MITNIISQNERQNKMKAAISFKRLRPAGTIWLIFQFSGSFLTRNGRLFPLVWL